MDDYNKELKQLLWYDYDRIKNMNAEQLESITRRIQRFARDRKKETTRKLKELGISTPTIYRKFEEKKGKVVTQGRLTFRIYNKKLENKEQKRNYLLSLFLEAKKFLEAQTSTVEGWYKTLNKFKSTIEQHTGEKFDFDKIEHDKSAFKTFFEVYNELKAKSSEWKNLDSAQALKYINEYMVKHPRMKKKGLIKNLKNMAKNVYETSKNKERELEDFDEDIFSFDGKV